MHDFNKLQFGIYNIDQDIIHKYHGKNIKLLNLDLIDIILNIDSNVKIVKGNDLVRKMAISSIKNNLLLITFFDSHLKISIS